jgi:hypothetical protein
MGYLQSWVDLD